MPGHLYGDPRRHQRRPGGKGDDVRRRGRPYGLPVFAPGPVPPDGSGSRARRSRSRRGGATGVDGRHRRLSGSCRRTRPPRHLRSNPVRQRAVRGRPARAVGSLLGESDRHDRPLAWRQRVRRLPARARSHVVRQVLYRDGPAARSRTVAATGWSPCRSPRMGLGNGENAIRACDSGVGGGRSGAGPEPGSRGLSGDRRELAGARCVALLAVLRSDRPLDREARRRRRAFRQRRAALARDREAAAHPSHSVAAQLG